MDNIFLGLNVIGIALYLSEWKVLFALNSMDSELGKTGVFKRGRFSTGILLIYLAWLSKSFGWDGILGFNYGVGIQLIWLFWNFRSEMLLVHVKGRKYSSLKLAVYNTIGVATLIYQVILLFTRNS